MVHCLMRANDARALLRLLGSAGDLVASRTSPQVVRGLAEIIEAPVAVGVTGTLCPGGALVAIESVAEFLCDSEGDRGSVCDELARLRAERDPVLGDLEKGNERIATIVRGDFLVSVLRREEANGSENVAIRALVFKRPRGQPGFGARERDLVHLFLSECPWLYEEAPHVTTSAGGQPLSRRQRETFHLLLTGAPEKQVAAALGVSRHTAHEYIKVVYRKMRVSSRAELMAQAVKLTSRVDAFPFAPPAFQPIAAGVR
jgi:DNA-binding CsgD family transcriptional regulator